MARLGRRERAALKELTRLDNERKAYAATIQGTSRGYSSANYTMPIGKPSPKWEWDWKADRRINHGGKWCD